MNGCVFLLLILSFVPCLVPMLTCFCCTRCSTFTPLCTWSNNMVDLCRREPDLEHCVHTFQQKIAMVVTYVFPSSDLKAKIYSVSSLLFWLEAWKSKREIWTMSLLHGNIMCVSIRPWGRPSFEGAVLLLLCLLHDEHSSPSSCTPASCSTPLRLKSKTHCHISYPSTSP